MIHLVLLSGGSGQRLWPLSNSVRSKQFLKILRDEAGNAESMMQRVFSQIEAACISDTISIVAPVEQRGIIADQLKGGYSLVLEPERRDTTAAIMLACAHLKFNEHGSEDDSVLVMPVDPFTTADFFERLEAVEEALSQSNSEIVLMGVRPTYPSEKYGYIRHDTLIDGRGRVTHFAEKPNKETASLLIAEGALWNCGVFGFKLGYLLKKIKEYVPLTSYQSFEDNYAAIPKKSFDYEIVEKCKRVSVVLYEGEWRDLGTWDALADEMLENVSGRVTVDDDTCSNVHVINETNLPMIVTGVENAIIVATPDGILVSEKSISPEIKALVEKAAEGRPMCEKRQWGEYRVLDYSLYADDLRSLTKELVIKDGCQLSYQCHCHRREIWTVVAGEGEVVLDGVISVVTRGDVVEIMPMQMHSMRAFSELRIIEVQLGDSLDEDDITRKGYFWD